MIMILNGQGIVVFARKSTWTLENLTKMSMERGRGPVECEFLQQRDSRDGGAVRIIIKMWWYATYHHKMWRATAHEIFCL